MYDAIGRAYMRTRRADPRLVDAVWAALALPAHASVMDVGAGTGNYGRALARPDLQVVAIEPSHVSGVRIPAPTGSGQPVRRGGLATARALA